MSVPTWKQWAQRDDRAWLQDLAEQQWSVAYCRKSLHPLLPNIVTSLQFGNHARFGATVSESELLHYQEKFLKWMLDSREWISLRRNWEEDESGPWSLPLVLSRAYLRCKALQPVKRSAPAAFEDRIVKELSAPIVEVMNLLSSELEASDRIIFLLHLEGLVHHEIAALLGCPEDQVALTIDRAKESIEFAARERKSVA